MTLAGTRPPTVDEWELYEPHHRARMSFRPGLTGMWQVSGRSNITDFEEVVKLDTQYISEWSLKCLKLRYHYMVRVEDNICTYRYGEILHASAVLLKLFMSSFLGLTI